MTASEDRNNKEESHTTPSEISDNPDISRLFERINALLATQKLEKESSETPTDVDSIEMSTPIVKECSEVDDLSPLFFTHKKRKLETRTEDTIQRKKPRVESREESFDEIKEKAAIKIQRAFRKSRFLKAYQTNPYSAYINLVKNAEETDTALHEFMFGSRQAPFSSELENPYTYKKSRYHRDDSLHYSMDKKIYNAICKTFKLDMPRGGMLPIALLKNTPPSIIEDFIVNEYGEQFKVKLHTLPNISIGILEFPEEERHSILEWCTSAGLTASPWALFTNLNENIKMLPDSVPQTEFLDSHIRLNLPKTLLALKESDIYKRLKHVSKRDNHACHRLAKTLLALLSTPPQLSRHAIERISLMIDVTITFHEYSYEKFSDCIYVVVHELSLALLSQTEEEKEALYKEYRDESFNTLCNALGVEACDLEQQQFVSSPANSGTNAHKIALLLAKRMKTEGGRKPKIKLVSPYYYEFRGHYSHDFKREDRVTRGQSADIYILSVSSIVKSYKLYPPIDLNAFIKKNIIETITRGNIILVLDASCCRYDNLTLESECKEMIESGQLSILIHESHQKFGLLHTDQAQYGRIHGFCSKTSFEATLIEDVNKKGRQDFLNHTDMRIGAFIAHRCSKLLEEIKGNQFFYGHCLREVLKDWAQPLAMELIKQSNDETETFLLGSRDLYFLMPNAFEGARESFQKLSKSRDSFGHFHSVWAEISLLFRYSPGGGSLTDALFEAARIYLFYHFSEAELHTLLFNLDLSQRSLSQAEQIVYFAILINALDKLDISQKPFHEQVMIFVKLTHLMDACRLIKSRPEFNVAKKHYINIKKRMLNQSLVLNPKPFFNDCHTVMMKHVELSAEVVDALKEQPLTTSLLAQLEKEAATTLKLRQLIPSSEKREDNSELTSSATEDYLDAEPETNEPYDREAFCNVF